MVARLMTSHRSECVKREAFVDIFAAVVAGRLICLNPDILRLEVRRNPSTAERERLEVGIVDATRFVMAVERGEGDSVEKYAQLWDGMTLEAVHDETLKARERGELAP
jgi:hypothetical protein